MNLARTVVSRSLAGTTMISGLAALYQTGPTFSRFLDGHLADLRASSNSTIERSGRVLEGCKAGFGIGYAAPVIVLAAGQVILGNPLHAVGTVGTAATLTNPVAMTCAAVGAVLYGYGALTDGEREALLDTLSRGLKLGIELVRAVIAFSIQRLRELLDSEQMAELRRWVKEAAEACGRHLSDVTHALLDRIADGATATIDGTKHVVHRGTELAVAGAGHFADHSSSIAGVTKSAIQSAYDTAATTVKRFGVQPSEPGE